MAASGFEGFEKRLELHFSGEDSASINGGLRRLHFPSLEKVLHAVQCTVVSAVGNTHFDSYVLSESSLFVYPTKIIIKTCGTTQLLNSVRPFIHHGLSLGLTLVGCKYTRGSFIFPLAQPYPYTSFKNEVTYLESNLPKNLAHKKACTMNSKSNHKWHVFTAFEGGYCSVDAAGGDESFTVDICMTELDPTLARNFFRFDGGKLNGDSAGREMTRASGIDKINENALVCDYAFDPCGYSMNTIKLDRYSTIHVTPEDGFSYASFECVGSSRDGQSEIHEVLRRVIGIFGPGKLSVSTSAAGPTVRNRMWRGMARAIEPLGMRLTSCTACEFPSAGSVVFQLFVADRK